VINIAKLEKFNLSRSQWCEIIDQWVFNERDRALLKRRLLDGICFDKLAEEFGLSVQRTKEIVSQEQKRLFTHV
jgi:hypothetical protein